MKKVVATCLGAAVGLTVALAAWAEARSEKDAPRVASVLQLMEGISKSNMSRLQSVVGRGAPTSEEAWAGVAQSGALLNELSFLIVEAGRVRDEVWTDAAGSLRAASAELVTAADAKNFDAVKTAIGKLGAACKTCHDVHKK